MDLVGPLPETQAGHKYILTMMDGFSRYVSATTIPCKEASVVANQLLEHWICQFGTPVRIHTDQGREFCNMIWEQLMDRLQICKTETPPYNPQSNSVERFHKTLNQLLRVYMDRHNDRWDQIIHLATFAYNTKASAATGVTPFEAWMGRKARLPIDLVLPTPGYRFTNEVEFISETMARFHLMYKYIRKRKMGASNGLPLNTQGQLPTTKSMT